MEQLRPITAGNEPISILIVDDEPRNLTVLETVLDDPAYRLVRAESADAALLALVADEFALLILDVRMPGMTGFELAQMIKTRKKTAQVPIIFLTAYYHEDEHMLEGYDTGAVDYLHKPINPAVLRSKVAVFAELYRKNREADLANRALSAEVATRREAQDRLRALNDTLEQQVVQRTEVLTRTRMALNESGERYRSLFESSLDAIFSIDFDSRFTAANPAALRLLGRTSDELAAIRLLDVCAPDQRDTAENALHAAARNECAVIDTAIVAANGERRELFISCAPAFLAGEVVGLGCIARDVTERRRADEALRESQTRLQLAQKAAGFGVWDQDVTAGTLTWSDEQWRLHGLEPRPGPVARPVWLACIHLEDRANVEARWDAGLADLGQPLEVEYRVLHEGNVTHWLQVKGKVTHESSGQALRMVGVTADVTTSRETEAALRRLGDELEVRIHQEIAAREAAQTRAAQAERLQALGQLAGGIAHDFNNVLQAVMGALRLIEKRRADAEGVRRLTEIANGAIERGISITRRLLALGGKGNLKTEALDAATVLHDMQEVLSHTLGADIDILVRSEPGLYSALADRGELESVLVNLATNARDAMPGGGRLTLSAARDSVPYTDRTHPSALAPGRYVRLTIADTGVGMDAAILARVREPFFTTKRTGSGTGLGLAMAHSFAEQSGGALSIESEPGNGTTVILWLPEATPAEIVPELRHASDEARSGATMPERTARILLVDDELMIRTFLAAHLEDSGYDVVMAATGSEALEIAATTKLDALVTDLSMPGIDGLSVIRGAQELHPGLPAVLLTGYAGDETALAMKGAMSRTFSLLLKPVTEGQLLDRIAALLAARPTAQ